MKNLSLLEKIKIKIYNHYLKYGVYPTHIVMNTIHKKEMGKKQKIFDCKIVYLKKGGINCFNEKRMIAKLKATTKELKREKRKRKANTQAKKSGSSSKPVSTGNV